MRARCPICGDPVRSPSLHTCQPRGAPACNHLVWSAEAPGVPNDDELSALVLVSSVLDRLTVQQARRVVNFLSARIASPPPPTPTPENER